MRIVVVILLCSIAAAHAQTVGPSLPAKKTAIDWEAMIPKMRQLLKSTGTSEERYPIGIRETADLTDDGVPEALVYLGGGGAYTDSLALIRLVNNKPVLAEFKGRDRRRSGRDCVRSSDTAPRSRFFFWTKMKQMTAGTSPSIASGTRRARRRGLRIGSWKSSQPIGPRILAIRAPSEQAEAMLSKVSIDL
jgi:hypothetical protein